jgi:hypothetical protein
MRSDISVELVVSSITDEPRFSPRGGVCSVEDKSCANVAKLLMDFAQHVGYAQDANTFLLAGRKFSFRITKERASPARKADWLVEENQDGLLRHHLYLITALRW